MTKPNGRRHMSKQEDLEADLGEPPERDNLDD
jgi:hypothetical protein